MKCRDKEKDDYMRDLQIQNLYFKEHAKQWEQEKDALRKKLKKYVRVKVTGERKKKKLP
jgi:hypothetical protein